MLMELEILQAGAPVAWAQIDLDFGSKTWAMQENRGWGGLGVAKEGYMEFKAPDVMWLGNRVILNQNNAIVLRKPPTKSPDPQRDKGEGWLNDPFNSNYKDAVVRWNVRTLTPVRQRILDICEGILLPTPDTFLTPGQEPMTRITTQTYATGGVTNCGVFPGWIAKQLGAGALVPESVQLPKYTMKSGKVVTPDPITVTSPMTAWEQFVMRLEQMRGLQAGTLWVPYNDKNSDNRPQPGDIYALSKTPGGQFGHVGIMVDSTGTMWITADAGQGAASTEIIQVPDPNDGTKKIDRVKFSSGMAAGYRRRKFDPTSGAITGEFNAKGFLKGWVDVDKLFAGWQ